MVSPEAQKLAKKFGYLTETIERFIVLFGLEETEAMINAYEKTPKQSIRVNTLRTTLEILEERLVAKNFI
ncbi:MAG: hypothetical protein ACTSSH_06040 [Candidatus Heimdallarchaeota archaeon]